MEWSFLTGFFLMSVFIWLAAIWLAIISFCEKEHQEKLQYAKVSVACLFWPISILFLFIMSIICIVQNKKLKE